MLCYLALLWNDMDPVHIQNARKLARRFQIRTEGWKSVVEQPGMRVFCKAHSASTLDEVHVLPNGQGVILGKLFERAYTERTDTHQVAPTKVQLDERHGNAFIATEGRALMNQFWGQYIAFLHDPASHRRWVIRDPSGDVPCQRTSIQGMDVYFMRLEDCEKITPVASSINRHYLLGYLMYASNCVRETSINGIETVLPGECVEHQQRSRTHAFLWNPLDISGTDVVEDQAEAVRLMRRTIRSSVHAWSSCFDGILHHLSGGLDSSVVLSCLADAPTHPRILCQTNFLEGPNSDERIYSRLSAERAGVEYIEREAETTVSAESLRPIFRSLFPIGWPVDLSEDVEKSEFLRSRGLTAEFKGHGGDEVGFRFGPLPTAVEFVWRHGIRPRLLSIALDDAAVDGMSLWAALERVRRYGIFKQPWHMRMGVPQNHKSLMTASLKRDAQRDLTLWHPLYREQGNVSPGKFEHAYSLTYNTGKHHVPGAGSVPAVLLSPLLSQPVLELSLRTPLYVLRAGGRDRDVVRRAFTSDVPGEIIRRKSKAFGTEQYRLVLQQNFSTARELLLDGFLAREGFLDRVKLEQALSVEMSTGQCSPLELYDYLGVEVWAQNWIGTSTANVKRELTETFTAG